MAVITKFIVVRNGVELDMVFEVKKEAEAYDKMLDAAENLAAFIKQSNPQLNLDQKTLDEISIYLAKNTPEVTRILKGIKPIAPAAPASGKGETPEAAAPPAKDNKAPSGKKPEPKAKKKSRR